MNQFASTFSPYFFSLLFLCLLSISSHAQMDIDQADSLDFEAFHTEKKDSIKLPGAPQSPEVPQEEKHDEGHIESSRPSPTHSRVEGSLSVETVSVENNSGKFYEISVRYSPAVLNNNPSTTAANAINALHQQMAQLCPQGWTKLGEKSLPFERDFYLYYEFRCF